MTLQTVESGLFHGVGDPLQLGIGEPQVHRGGGIGTDRDRHHVERLAGAGDLDVAKSLVGEGRLPGLHTLTGGGVLVELEASVDERVLVATRRTDLDPAAAAELLAVEQAYGRAGGQPPPQPCPPGEDDAEVVDPHPVGGCGHLYRLDVLAGADRLAHVRFQPPAWRVDGRNAFPVGRVEAR